MVNAGRSATQIVTALIVLAIGLILLPVFALFASDAQANGSLQSFSGATQILELLPFIASASLVIGGVTMLFGAFGVGPLARR